MRVRRTQRVLPGRVDVVAEPGYLHVWQRHDAASLFAFSTLWKYGVRTTTRFPPFVEGGVGILHAARVPPSGAPFNFLPQAGGGVRYALTRQATNAGRGAYHPLSNANTGKDSPRLNTLIFSLGSAWHY